MSNDSQLSTVETKDVEEAQADKVSSLALITDSGSMESLSGLAKMMSGSKVTVPKHLQGNEGDCMAIIIQSMNWGLNPFAVAQKTHIVNGALGYEAQLVNAVLKTSGSIHGRFRYEYRGEGNNLECRVGAVPAGESEVEWNEWLNISNVTTKNSPLWKTNPKQQIGYLQVKNWARLYCPEAILGVYTDDELGDIPKETDITPYRRVSGAEAAQAARQSQSSHSEDVHSLVEALESIARDEGLQAYAKAWKELEPAQRKAVGPDTHARIKQLAVDSAIPGEAVQVEE